MPRERPWSFTWIFPAISTSKSGFARPPEGKLRRKPRQRWRGFALGIEPTRPIHRPIGRAKLGAGRTGALSMILQSLAGLPAFLVYFCTALVAVAAYLFVYTRVTPHDEFLLIRENNPAAAIALG